MKIIFMGTPACAADVLSSLLTAGKNVIAVISRPDKPRGRGLKVQGSKVSGLAEEHNIAVYKPENVKDSQFLKEISGLKPDLIIVVAYGKILPKEFIDIPKYGCINVHASLLPKYRGASPIQSALLNGDKETGITIMKINEKLDAGDIIAQKKIKVYENDNAGSLSDRLFKAGAELLSDVLNDIDRVKGQGSRVQDESSVSYAKSIKKSDGTIDFSKPAEEIRNMIRAFTPWPGAMCKYNGKTIKLIECRGESRFALPNDAHPLPGQIIDIIKNEGFVVSTGEGSILILEIQPENSKKMSAEEFVRGYRIKSGDIFT
ncbi:MAG: methionyl-tRNA formyltransferase [Candidatus Margulisiibacteriota bacterium]